MGDNNILTQTISDSISNGIAIPTDDTASITADELLDQLPPDPNPEDTDSNSIVGKWITLGTNAVWRSPSDSIYLNVFTGNISVKVTKAMPESDITAITRAINFGVLKLTDKEVKGTPAGKDIDSVIPSSMTSEAYRRVDMANMETFGDIVKFTTNPMLIKEMIRVEQNERARDNVLKALKKQLQELTS